MLPGASLGLEFHKVPESNFKVFKIFLFCTMKRLVNKTKNNTQFYFLCLDNLKVKVKLPLLLKLY